MAGETALSKVKFSQWDLPEVILTALEEAGWDYATKIQAEAIPLARSGHNIVGQARTGSGKTAAFGIPCIEACEKSGKTQAIIISPTRELAQQIATELNWLQGEKGLTILTVYGGTDIEKQAKKLDAGVEVIVGTPGRIIDMSKRGHIDLANITTLCLDEADRMLDMGFFPDIIWVLERMVNRQRTMLFSATFPEEVLEAANTFISEAAHVMSDDLGVEIPEIDQLYISVGRGNKLWALGRILVNMDDDDQMMVFSNTKGMVDLLVQRLNKFRFQSAGLHGDLSQNRREKIIEAFKSGREKVLVCTDVAARGIDVDGVTIVVNYDLPSDIESYVHRIGRTGRMGRSGVAWSFVSRDDEAQLSKIAATWDLNISESEPPSLPEGIDREPVKRQQDWDEVANNFGMVSLTISVGAEDGANNHTLTDWVQRQGKLDTLAIGEVSIGENSSQVEIHLEKVEAAMRVLSGKSWGGNNVTAELTN